MSINEEGVEVRPIWVDLLGEDKAGPFFIGGRCRSCGFVTLGVRETCPDCWESRSMSPCPVGRNGTVYSYTVLHTVPAGYSDPFAVGYVDVEHDIRVFAHLEQLPEALQIGAPVALTIAPLRRESDGTVLLGPLYRAHCPKAGGGA
jgi:uncharacterized protein